MQVMHLVNEIIRHFLLQVIGFFWFGCTQGILHSSYSYEYSTSQGGPLIFETELCPGPGVQRQIIGGWRESAIILEPSFTFVEPSLGKSPCVFNVTSPLLSLTPPLKEGHPRRARLLGMFITENKDIPWPVSNNGDGDLCLQPLHINVMGLIKDDAPMLPHLHHTPKPLCRVTNEIFMPARRRVRHLQSSLWLQISTNRLALSVDKELDFTKIITNNNKKDSLAKIKMPIVANKPTFAHLMFLFNSTGQKCYIRVEHYRIGKFWSKEGCDEEQVNCDIYPCADELRLQLVTTDLWLKRGFRRHLSHNQNKWRTPNEDGEGRSNDKDDDPGHPSVRVLLCAWTPVLLCLYLLCRRRKWIEDSETDEVDEEHEEMRTGTSANNNSQNGTTTIGIKDSPPSYSEVLEMDILSPPPPTYSDVCKNEPPSGSGTALGKIFSLERKPSLPTPTNV